MKETIYFGTYTKRLSKGIYRATFDSVTESFSDINLVCKNQNPTYLATTKNEMVAIGADDNACGIFLYDSLGNILSTSYDDTSNPCYVSYDQERDLIYTANYHSRAISVYQVNEEKELELLDRDYLEGNGPHPNQGQSHPHFADLTTDRYLITCDLGADRLACFDINQGQLTEINHFDCRPGSGPRHLVFHPREKIAYLVCELDSTVDVLFYDGYGAFELYRTYSTLPEGVAVSDNATAAIRLSSDGRFLYISNRGHDSITIFNILTDGDLVWQDNISSAGHIPRDFALTQDEQYVIVAHQESDNVGIFKRSQENGSLELISDQTMIPEVVCVKPLN